MFCYRTFEVKAVTSDNPKWKFMIVGYSDDKHYNVYGNSVLDAYENFRHYIDFLFSAY